MTAATTLVALGLAVPTASSATTAAPLSFCRTVLQDQQAYGEPSLAVSADGKHTAVGGDCEIDFLPNNTLINADLEVTDSAIRLSTDFGKTWHGTQTAGTKGRVVWAKQVGGQSAFDPTVAAPPAVRLPVVTKPGVAPTAAPSAAGSKGLVSTGLDRVLPGAALLLLLLFAVLRRRRVPA